MLQIERYEFYILCNLYAHQRYVTLNNDITLYIEVTINNPHLFPDLDVMS